MVIAILAVEIHTYKGHKYDDSNTGSRNTRIHTKVTNGTGQRQKKDTHIQINT